MRRARLIVRSSRRHAVVSRACGVLLALAFLFVGVHSPLRGLVPRAAAPGTSGGATSEEEDPSETGATEKFSELRVEALLRPLAGPLAPPSARMRVEEPPRDVPAPRVAIRCRRPAVVRLLL